MTNELKGILNKEDTNKEIEQVNWSDMFSTACRNNIAPFLFDEVMKVNSSIPIEESVITKNIRLLALRESAEEWSKTILKQE